jgi:hypothetical protein
MLARLLPVLILVSLAVGNSRGQIGEPPGPGWHYLMTTGPDRYGTLRIVNDTLMLTVNRPNDSIPNYHVILYSADHGVTWDSMPPIPQVYDWEWPPGTEGLHPIQLLRNEHDTSFRFVQTFDMGRSWVELGRFPDAMARYFFSGSFRGGGSYFRNPADRQQVLVGFDYVAGRGTIEGLCVRSKDNCRTWEAVQFPLPKEGVGAVNHLLFDRTDPRIWYVAVAPYSESNLAAAYYQTTDDGQTFTQVNHWAKDAGIAYAGELRSLSHGQDDLYGGKVDDYTGVINDTGWNLGFNSYSPLDPPKVEPQFVNLFQKLAPLDTALVQFVYPPVYIRDPKTYYYISVEYEPPFDTVLKQFAVRVGLTVNDASIIEEVLSVQSPLIGFDIDQSSGRIYIGLPRERNRIFHTSPRPDSTDYWYTDQFKPLLSVKSVPRTEELPSISVFPSVVEAEAQVMISLPTASKVDLSVWDVSGRKIKTLYQSGSCSRLVVPFDRDREHLAAGWYFLQLQTPHKTIYAKIILR